MTTLPTSSSHERRKFPRFYIHSRMTMALEDTSIKESIGLGEPGDISMGGVRVRNLPAGPTVRIGAHLGILLIDGEDALSLQGNVVHHGTPETFGVEFRDLTTDDMRNIRKLIERLHKGFDRSA